METTWPTSSPRIHAPTRAQKHQKDKNQEAKRATRACDQCRRLKERCEGGTPCSRCKHARRMCEFKDGPAGIQLHVAPSRNSRSSRAPTDNDDNGDLHERMMYMEQILKHKIHGISLDAESLARIAKSLPSLSHSDIEDTEDLAIEEEVPTIQPVEQTTTHYSGEFSYWNFSMRIKRHIDNQLPDAGTEGVPKSEAEFDYWRPEQLNTGSNNLTTAVAACPPRQIAEFLFKVFFKRTEWHYFCVDHSWLVKKLDMLYDNPASLGPKAAAFVSIILTVLAIGTQYAYLDSPRHGTMSTPVTVTSEEEIGAIWYQHAIRLLPEIIECSCLESVQACLLFGVYSLPVDASGLGFIYLNLAIRLAMQNGMHRKYTGNALTQAMVETRNRVWWTTYALERKITVFHGRPLSTHRTDVDTPVPRDVEGLQSAEAALFVPYMVASSHLSDLLAESSAIMLRLRDIQKYSLHTILSDLISMKSTLAAWYSNLPQELSVLPVQRAAQTRRSTHHTALYLGLEYCLVRMFIGRPFLFSRNQGSSPAAASAPGKLQEDYVSASRPTSSNIFNARPVPGSRRAELVDDCVLAASEALGVLQTIRDTGSGLARASYIEYSSCRATLLVLIAHSIQHPAEADQCRRLLQDGLQLIRDMSVAGKSAQSEVALIEALEKALTQLHKRSEVIVSEPVGRENSNYESFKQWSELWRSGSTPVLSTASSSLTQQTPIHPTSIAGPQHRGTALPGSMDSFEQYGYLAEDAFGGGGGGGIRQNGNLSYESQQTFFGDVDMMAWSEWPIMMECSQVPENFTNI